MERSSHFTVERSVATLVIADPLLVYPNMRAVIGGADVKKRARIGARLEMEIPLIPENALIVEKLGNLRIPVARNVYGGRGSEIVFLIVAADDIAMTPFLEVKDMKKSYGAIKAVDGVTLSVGPGEIVGVIGPNGSGKTTLFNSILGQIKPTAGSVEFCGENITGMSPLELSRRGVGRTFQTLQVFVKLSVRDNLIAAAQEFKGTMPGRLFASPDAGLGHHADQMIELFRLKHVSNLPAGSLSYGQQKLIDIAMAFMPAPRLVLLDEPCAGVNPSLVDELRALLLELNKTQGGSFVVIEHNMDFIMKLCPHVICMVEGKVLAEGPPAAVQANPQVLEAYLGN